MLLNELPTSSSISSLPNSQLLSSVVAEASDETGADTDSASVTEPSFLGLPLAVSLPLVICIGLPICFLLTCAFCAIIRGCKRRAKLRRRVQPFGIKASAKNFKMKSIKMSKPMTVSKDKQMNDVDAKNRRQNFKPIDSISASVAGSGQPLFKQDMLSSTSESNSGHHNMLPNSNNNISNVKRSNDNNINTASDYAPIFSLKSQTVKHPNSRSPGIKKQNSISSNNASNKNVYTKVKRSSKVPKSLQKKKRRKQKQDQ